MPPAPRPIRGTSETKCSRRPPSHDDTDVVGWRRVSCWWRRLRVTTIIAGAAPNPRRRPIATNKPSTPAAGDHLHCHTEHRTRCWRRSSTPAGRSRMLVAVHGLAVRSASDATRATYVLNAITAPAEMAWVDAGVPKPLVDEGREFLVALFRFNSDTPLPPTTDVPSFKEGCASFGFEAPHTYAILLRGSEIYFYLLWRDNSIGVGSILPPQAFHPRLDGSHQVLREKSVAIIGCGSLGSKVGTMLARSGVSRFFLVDDDILLPDNFVRNDLDWRDVGSHKANALARRLSLANPATQSEVWRARLGGQESGASAETMLKLIGDCDLIFDATANPDILNLISAIANVRKKSLVWAEVFGGGIGGLIARCRPELEPSPQHMRRAIENWFGEKGAQPVRSRRSYETGLDGPPLIADDADVSAIAAHAARLAIDLLIARQPSLFPHSVYAIGLGVGSVFEQPFQTFPIETGPPLPSEATPVLTEEELGEEVARLIKLFEARANEASGTSNDT